jgi:hypothetical protein
LNYKKNKVEDKTAVIKGLCTSDKGGLDNFFIQKAVRFLKTLDFCTAADLEKIKTLEK